MTLLIKYTLFAIIAIIANILCQDAINRLFHGQYDLYPSMISGTLVGLAVKYLLDNKYVFSFKSKYPAKKLLSIPEFSEKLHQTQVENLDNRRN